MPGTTDAAAAAVFVTVSTAAGFATTVLAHPITTPFALATTTIAVSATAVSISTTTVTLPCASIPTTPSHL